MRSRAALLPTPGDPFMLHYWFKNYEKWSRYIDKLYVCINSPIEQPAIDYMVELCKSYGAEVIVERNQVPHGVAIDKMLDICKEDLVLLVEDDGYVIKPEMIEVCFKLIEGGDYDLVGGKRGSCSLEILEKAKEVWGLSYDGLGDQGCNFWPCWLFTKKQILLDTDRNFDSRCWRAGELVEPLGWITEKDIFGDTLVNTSLQLRAMIPEDRIITFPQYHAGQIDLTEHETGRGLFDGKCPWVHIGSLSSGVCGVITDNQNRSLAYSTIKEPQTEPPYKKEWCTTELEQWEWARRVSFWLTYYERRQPGILDDLAASYAQGLYKILYFYKISIKKVRQLQAIYAKLDL